MDETGNPLTDKLELRYKIRKYDTITGVYSEERTLPEGEHLTQLSNKDIIVFQIDSIDNNYSLSREIKLRITIKDLIQPPPKDQASPSLNFYGESGEGWVVVTPVAERGFNWEYAVYKDIDNESAPTGEDIQWNTEVPTNLENGNFVKVRLSSSTDGALTNNFETKWIVVQGLTQMLDLSSIKVFAFDENNLYEPTQIISDKVINNIAFKFNGEQSGTSELQINSPLFIPVDPSLSSEEKIVQKAKQLRDTDGNVINNSELLQWAFNVSTSEEVGKDDEFTYARIVAKESADNISVIGSKIYVIKVDFLDEEKSIPKEIMTTIIGISGGVLVGGLASAASVIVRKKKKINLK